MMFQFGAVDSDTMDDLENVCPYRPSHLGHLQDGLSCQRRMGIFQIRLDSR